jgi:hypothetical protein
VPRYGDGSVWGGPGLVYGKTAGPVNPTPKGERMQNLISLDLTAADWTAVDTALTALETKLTKFLDLTPEERRTLSKMGDKSEAFCRQAVTVLGQNTNVLPPSFDLAELQADLANLDLLRPRLNRLQQLTEKASDTELGLGSDIMAGALEGYAQLKISGKGAGLDALRQQMSARFAKTKKKTTGGGTPPQP